MNAITGSGQQENSAQSFVLAHLSDLHLGPLPQIPAERLNLKRTLGALNWRRGRRVVHRPEIADLMVAEALRLGADHIAVTGDLCNLGLPEEHERALTWLQRSGVPQSLTVIPGNHDIYSSVGADVGVERWVDFMCSCERGVSMSDPGVAFPFVRIVGVAGGGVALIGLNSAIETPPFRAHGVLGDRQIAALGVALEATREAGLKRVVMLHHPPLVTLGRRHKELLDAAALEEVLHRHGAEMVIYGHNHRVDVRTWAARAGAVTVAGVASGSAARAHGGEPPASLNLYRFSPDVAGPRIEIEFYQFNSVSGRVERLERATDGVTG